MRCPGGAELGMVIEQYNARCARQVADRVIFMDAGQIVEMNIPDEFFKNPQHRRSELVLRQFLH